MKRLLILQLFGALVVAGTARATTNFDRTGEATNELAVDLHRQLATGNENLSVSPFSIESALAYDVRWRGWRHAHGDGAHAAFFKRRERGGRLVCLASAFAGRNDREDSRTGEEIQGIGGPSEPITLNIANRLFAQKDYDFRQNFLSLVKQNYGAGFEPSISLRILQRLLNTSTNGWRTRRETRSVISFPSRR